MCLFSYDASRKRHLNDDSSIMWICVQNADKDQGTPRGHVLRDWNLQVQTA